MSRALALALIGGLSLSALGADWPQWRGPGRDGRARVPDRESWPEALVKVWSVPVGVGHASPVTDAERVYQHARLGDHEVVLALDLASGAETWSARYPAPYTVSSAAAAHGPGPKSTPTLAGGRLFTLGIGGVLSAWDPRGGELLWRRAFEELGEPAPVFGTAMSPLVAGGRVVVHAGSEGAGALFALDPGSGETLWRWEGDGPGYASPVVAEVDGVRHVITQSETKLIGVDLESGALLWERPFTTPYAQNSVTSVVRGDLVVFSGLDQGVTAARLVRDGTGWSLEPLWESGEISLYMSSPVAVGGALYGFSHKKRGQFFAADLASGAVRWTSEGRQGANAALVALTPAAELVAFRPGAGRFEPLASYGVAGTPTWAHPAPLADGFLIKDLETLARWRLP
jgi:outer membrane protein assembly factor BamB